MSRQRRAVLVAATITVILLSGCGTEAVASLAVLPASSAPSATEAAAILPIEAGRLSAGQRYALETDPVLTIAPDDGWGAGPTAGGIQLINGQTIVRIATGFDQAYVGTGSFEPVGADADAIFAQVERNQRVATGASGVSEIGALSAKYLDADAIYELNEEGGADILSIGNGPLKLVDLFVNRIFVIDDAEAPILVIVSGPETTGLEQALTVADALMSSLAVDVNN